MLRGLVYKSALIYEMTMIAAYGRHYVDRYQAIADLIPAGASVLDVCCGPGILYQRYLRPKTVRYTGLDINEKFVHRIVRQGAVGRVHDLCSDDALPEADYVVMQASLYHFLPDAGPIVSRMLAAARSAVIIAEPIRNLSTSTLRPISWLARTVTTPSAGAPPERFTESRLTELFSQLDLVASPTFLISGGRERVYVFCVESLSGGPGKAESNSIYSSTL